MLNENEILENDRDKYFDRAKDFMLYKKNQYLKQGYNINDALLEAECDMEDKFNDVLSDKEVNAHLIIDVIQTVRKECGVCD